MTRYTFVLLVCRAIGVLAALSFFNHCLLATDRITSGPGRFSSASRDFASLPFGVIAIALAVPLLGIIVGVRASRLAESVGRNESRTEGVKPLLTALALAVVICSYFCFSSVGNAQAEAIFEWWVRSSSSWTAPGTTAPAPLEFLGSGPALLEAVAYLLALWTLLGIAFSSTRLKETL